MAPFRLVIFQETGVNDNSRNTFTLPFRNVERASQSFRRKVIVTYLQKYKRLLNVMVVQECMEWYMQLWFLKVQMRAAVITFMIVSSDIASWWLVQDSLNPSRDDFVNAPSQWETMLQYNVVSIQLWFLKVQMRAAVTTFMIVSIDIASWWLAQDSLNSSRDDFVNAPSQWETMLQYNVVSHSLGMAWCRRASSHYLNQCWQSPWRHMASLHQN